MEFKLYNPRTKVWVEFKPVGYIPGKDAFRATASATGEFGRVYGNTLAVTAASFATLGIAAEFEVGSALLASSRGVLIRYGSIASGQATRFGSFAYSQGAKFGAQVIEEFTIKNFFAKALLDGTVQLGSGILTKHDVGKSLNDINIISMLVAGVMPGEGFRPALRNSIITSTFKVTGERDEKGFHLYRELPDFTSITGVGKYLLNIGTGTVGDLVKLKVGGSTAPIFRAATRVMAQSESAILHWFSANRVMLGTMVTVGGSSLVDAIKDEEKERLIGKLEKMQIKKPHSAQTSRKK